MKLNPESEIGKNNSPEEFSPYFQALFMEMGQGVVYQDAEGKIVLVNPAAEKLLGLTFAQLIGKESVDPGWRAIHKDYSEFPGEEHPAMVCLRTGEPVHNVLMGVYNPREETYRWLLVHSVPYFNGSEGSPELVMTTFEDVTRMVEAEKQISESEARYKTFVENYPDIVAIFDKELRFTLVGGEGLHTLGIEKGRLENRKVQEVFELANDSEMVLRLWETLRGKEQLFRVSLFGKNHIVRTAPFKGSKGTIGSGLLMAQDLSLYEGIQESLKITEERYKTLLDTTSTGYVMLDAEGKILDANREFTRLVHQDSPAALLGSSIINYIGENDRRQMLTTLGELLDGEPVRNRTFELKTPDDLNMSILLNASLIQERDSRYVMAVATDITAYRLLEDRIRMESIGTLVLGISHDFNNILAKIMGHAALLESTKEDLPEKQRNSLRQISSAAEKGASLINKLHEFGKPLKRNSVVEDLYKSIEGVFAFFDRTSNRLIEKIVDIPRDRFFVYGDYHDVFFNLTKNAIDAIESRGALAGDYIRVSVDPDPRSDRNTEKEGGDLLKVLFCNSGPPIPEHVLPKIFEPGYSTKPLSKDSGRGFGLAMVYRDLQGRIQALNREDEGVCFELFLDRGLGAPPAEEAPREGDVTGNELVLLVDDEEAIIEFAQEALERSGYRVLTAGNGLDAVEKFIEKVDEIQLVVFDLTMPRMSGEEIFLSMKRIKPHCRFIVSTGHNQLHVEEKELQEVDAVLHKPYRPRQLLETIRTVLTRTDG